MKIASSLISLSLILATCGAAFAETVRVASKENAIRTECRFFAPVRTKVRLNDLLDTVSKEGDWLRVRFKGTSGCIHKSAVDDKQVDVSSLSGSRRSVSGDEVALAGKGFNPQVERSYKAKHPELNFQAIDRIEENSVSEEAIKKFIRAGGLREP